MKDGPYILACGKCNLPYKAHPVKHCPYIYEPIREKRKVLGYRVIRKKA